MFRYWGKASPKDGEGPRYHLLPYHSLDVAAVARTLLDRGGFGVPAALQASGLPPDGLKALLVCFIALHDIGKFARGFQNLVPLPELAEPDSRFRYGNGIRHDTLGLLCWNRIWRALGDSAVPDAQPAWRTLICAVTGHHGAPPLQDAGSLGIESSLFFHQDDFAAAAVFAREAAALLLPSDLTKPGRSHLPAFVRASWTIAGLAVLADWIGSNQAFFRYQTAAMPLATYWREHALPGAERALAELGLRGSEVRSWTGATDLFAYLSDPTPLQRYASEVGLADGPQLFLLEDVTGAGKTEAALILAHRLMAAGHAQGLYFGLPTMATSNQMYRRVGAVHRHLFTRGSRPSLILAHGARNLVDDFRETLLPADTSGSDYSAGEGTASSQCAAWLADSNKKALLAEVGVGPLDQALLAILPVRHQSLRLLGLTNKVLIADEIHAYDEYTGRLLQSLLEQHARQGGSAVLLSATLPASQRGKLIAAFRRGLGQNDGHAEQEDAPYPLASQISLADVLREPLETREIVRRRVGVRFVHDEDDVVTRIVAAVRAGQCVAWIRNTVDDAREAWARLRATASIDPERLLLFHSRYALADRLAIENRLLDALGKNSDEASRRGYVIVASQVIEQSVDIDADVMISDLAPIDLLIQRAGRLHRHVRDARGNPAAQSGRPAPELIVLAPEFVTDAPADWYARSFRRASYVYPNAAKLWLTQTALIEHGGIEMPGGARPLIESVYGADADLNTPPALIEAWEKELGKAQAERTLAHTNALDFQRGYCQDAGAWGAEESKPTRLGDEDRELALATITPEGLRPWAAGHPHPWAASMVKVAARTFDRADAALLRRHASQIEALRESHPVLRYAEILPLESTPEGWRSAGTRLRGGLVEVRYDAQEGLAVAQPGKGDRP